MKNKGKVTINMRKEKMKNVIRTNLLILAESEYRSQFKKSKMRINSLLPDEMCKLFSQNYAIQFKLQESPVSSITSKKRCSVINSSFINNQSISLGEDVSVNTHQKKNITELRRVGLGDKKLGTIKTNKDDLKKLGSRILDESVMSCYNSNQLKFNLNNDNNALKILTKRESEAKDIQRSFDKIQNFWSKFMKNVEPVAGHNDSLRYDEDLFDILYCKDIVYEKEINTPSKTARSNPPRPSIISTQTSGSSHSNANEKRNSKQDLKEVKSGFYQAKVKFDENPTLIELNDPSRFAVLKETYLTNKTDHSDKSEHSVGFTGADPSKKHESSTSTGFNKLMKHVENVNIKKIKPQIPKPNHPTIVTNHPHEQEEPIKAKIDIAEYSSLNNRKKPSPTNKKVILDLKYKMPSVEEDVDENEDNNNLFSEKMFINLVSNNTNITNNLSSSQISAELNMDDMQTINSQVSSNLVDGGNKDGFFTQNSADIVFGSNMENIHRSSLSSAFNSNMLDFNTGNVLEYLSNLSSNKNKIDLSESSIIKEPFNRNEKRRGTIEMMISEYTSKGGDVQLNITDDEHNQSIESIGDSNDASKNNFDSVNPGDLSKSISRSNITEHSLIFNTSEVKIDK